MLFPCLLLCCLVVCDCFTTHNKAWRKTFVSRQDLESSEEGKIVEKKDSVFKCNLRANEEKWAHLMCFTGSECLLADKKVFPAFLAQQIQDPVECMTDQEQIETILMSIMSTTTITTESTITTTRNYDKDVNYIISTDYMSAVEECFSKGGKPFIPKSQEEYDYFISIAEPRLKTFWYPLSDIEAEGKPVYADGKGVDENPYYPTDWNPKSLNTDIYDCVVYTMEFSLSWDMCVQSDNAALLCDTANSTSTNNTAEFNCTIALYSKERPELVPKNFFTVTSSNYFSLISLCCEKEGVPFVPKSKDEYEYFMQNSVSLTYSSSWFPLTDYEEEGFEVYSDGTRRNENPFEPTNWDPASLNSDQSDCVIYQQELTLRWAPCTTPAMNMMLCQKF